MPDRIVASISFEESTPPPGTTFETEGARYLKISAIDGRANHALLCSSSSGPDGPLLISVHGSGGSAFRGLNDHLAQHLPAAGCSVLAIDTRQAGKGVNRDNFFAVRRDIEAAFATARFLGFERIVLHGHSLGNIQALYFAATTWSPALKGVVLTSMFANLPWKSRNILPPGGDTYDAWQAEARAAARNAEFPALIEPMKNPAGPLAARMSAEHFLTYRDMEASAAVGTDWIRRVPAPILLIRHEGDTLVSSAEADSMLAAATALGALTDDASLKTITSASGANGFAAHDFIDDADRRAVTDHIGDWIKRRL